ncbi:host specificity factor TipJ family phage tail protein [Desulfocurvibacter africanus]|uniref:host specificity factor TipJ family phage tail protein n=1 Tax=Desulfocurvibacter africanus TaxID=873 RepID=UPI0004251D2B|nr:host specificity factor TipJ family phage tail protein [Desulfocurvibacter africanus]
MKIHYVRNQLDPLRSTELVEVEPGRPLRAYMAELHPLAPAGFDIVACINGRVVAEGALDLVPLADDSVVVTARPMGGGDSKNTWRIVAMVVVTIVAAVVSYGVGGVVAGSAFAGSVSAATGLSTGMVGAMVGAMAGAAISLAGSYAVNALIPPTTPDFGGPNSNQGNSPTYGWDPSPNASSEGVTLPVLYGRQRVAPPIIAKYVETVGDKQYLHVLMAVADHELQSIGDVEINGQPASKFRDVQVETRLGAANQSPIQHFNDLRTDIPLQAKIDMDWAAREIPGNTVQGLGICILCPGGLYKISKKGKFESQVIRLCIEMRRKGETEWTRKHGRNLTVRKVTTWYWSGGCYANSYNSEYQVYEARWVELEAGSKDRQAHVEGERYNPSKDKQCHVGGIFRSRYIWRWIYGETIYVPGEIELDYVEMLGSKPSALRQVFWFDNLEAGEYEVRVRFAEQPPTGQSYGTDAYLEFVQTSITDDFSYPGTALLAVRALATDQLSGGMPRITCLAERSSVLVYDPEQDLAEHRPTNPAWACYDLLRSELAGNVPVERILYPAFKSWAEWCEEKGLECNLYFDSPSSLRRALDMLSTLGRGTIVQMGSLFTCIVDRPWTAPMSMQRFLFTMGNMVADSYREEFLAYQERANAVEITYFDAAFGYSRQTVELYQHGFDTSSQGIKKRAETLFGCTSRSQALAHAQALLNRNRYLSLTVSFDADADAIACMPGDVIDVSHDVPQWGFSGRILSAGPDYVELDREVTLLPGKVGDKGYVLQLKRNQDDKREEVAIAGVAQETSTSVLSLAGNWTHGLPQAGDLYAFGESKRVSKAFRVLSITRSSDLRRRITALEYLPEVYEGNVPDGALDPVNSLPAVEGLIAKEVWTMGSDGSGRSILDLSWRGMAMAWQVFLREPGVTDWARMGLSLLPSFRVDMPLEAGRTYEVAVSATSAAEDGQTAKVTVLGKLAPPSDVEGFLAYVAGEEIAFRWEHIPDMDLWGYEIRYGETWESAKVCVDGVQENSARWRPPGSGTYSFLIKALDNGDNYSRDAATSVATISLEQAVNVVLGGNEIPDYVGQASLEGLVWLPMQERVAWIPSLVDSQFDPGITDQDIAAYRGDICEGIFTSRVFDLGRPADFRWSMGADCLTVNGEATDLSYPERTNLTHPLDTDTSVTGLSTYVPEYRCSEDGLAWSDWELWTSGVDFKGIRACQARYRTVLESYQHYFAYMAISPVVDAPDQVALLPGVQITDANAGRTYRLYDDLGLIILSTYHVNVTVLGTAGIYPVVEKQSDRFTVRLFNPSGAKTTGTVDIRVGGF